MNVKLNDIYKIIRAEYPNKFVFFHPDREISDITQRREGTVGNSWAFNVTFDESEDKISVIDINIQFRCDAVGT